MIIEGTEYKITETEEYRIAESIGLTKRGNKVTIKFSKKKEDNEQAMEALRIFFSD